jgi:hypothetical protein
MAISKGYLFLVSFDDAFPQGLVTVGDVMPDAEYQARDERAAGRSVRQRVDEATGKRQSKVTVTDPHEPNAKRKSFEIMLLADVQPDPTTGEVLLGMRPVELEGLTAVPRIAGNGEFKYQSFLFRTTGFRAAGKSAGSAPAGSKPSSADSRAA